MKILDFYNFIYERQLVWYNKEHLKKSRPWTKDHRLHIFKFCNIYRECDKGTIHLIKNIINTNISLEKKIFNVLIYRRFNIPTFFDRYGIIEWNPFPFKTLSKKMKKDKEAGMNLFNDAYLISQTHYKGRKIKDKYIHQLSIFKDFSRYIHVVTKQIKTSQNIQWIHTYLKKILFGTGDFLGYQYCTDLTYFPEFKDKWKDVNNFVAMGPGSKPGVDIIYEQYKDMPKTKDKDWHSTQCYNLWQMQKYYFKKLKKETGKDWLKIRYTKPYYDNPYLSLSNIQNCLCEFRKYIMLKRNPNKRKRYYKIERVRRP